MARLAQEAQASPRQSLPLRLQMEEREVEINDTTTSATADARRAL
jgi:hypothetical protein